MSQDTNEARPAAGESAVADATAGGRRTRRGGWLRLAIVVVVAGLAGALAAANWHERPFSFVVVDADIKAGIVILASVALGFVLGVVFLWSALERK